MSYSGRRVETPLRLLYNIVSAVDRICDSRFFSPSGELFVADSPFVHEHLNCGMEVGILPLPRRHIVSFEIRVLAGACEEPEDRLGLARVVEDSLTKGTRRYSARQLSDAFDALGAIRGSGAGRETIGFSCTVLPQYFERAVALHAEFLRHPTFPADAVDVAVAHARQEHLALNDDPHGLTEKLINARVYGPILGRHELGEPETLSRISRKDVTDFWKRVGFAGRMQASVVGPVEPAEVRDVFEKYFDGFGSRRPEGRSTYPLLFTPGTFHFDKPLEQEHLSLCFQGVSAQDPDYSIQRILIGVLAGGMSGRLFTEVREKLGLVYWVSAWHDTPRGAGMIFIGASTTPDRCDLTLQTLFRELDRLSEDLADDEVDRAKATIAARIKTRGDATRALCRELADDLFHWGRPRTREEKLGRVLTVTSRDVARFLEMHPRKPLCVVTLGPRALIS